MKRVIQTAMIGVIILVLQGNVSPSASTINSTAGTTLKSTHCRDLFTYSWYEDEDYTLYTGYNSAVNTELARLRSENPSYIFSSTPGTGLIQYEYGQHPFYVPAIIYSDINY